jgi:hypothetical protein
MAGIKKALIAYGAMVLVPAFAQASGSSIAFQLQSGETPQESLMMSQIQAQAGQLQAAWLAGGYPRASKMPSITSGTILAPTTIDVTTPPAAPQLQITYTVDPNSWLDSIYAEFFSPHGQRIVVQYQPPAGVQGPQSGTIDIQSPPGRSLVYDVASFFTGYSEAGTWTMEFLVIMDHAGDQTVYDESQLEKFFKPHTVTVSNSTGLEDIKAPAVSSAAIINNPATIALSSQFPSIGASFTATDSGSGGNPPSGVNSAYLCVQKKDKTSNVWCQTTSASAPFSTSNTLSSWVCLGGTIQCTGTTVPTGTWTVTNVDICDVPGNCYDASSAADIKTLFGGTADDADFTVQ